MKISRIQNDEDFEAVAKSLCAADEGDSQYADKVEATKGIVDAVRKEGDAAVAEFTQKFDGVSLAPEDFEVSADEIDRAMAKVDVDLIRSLERAHENIRRFHAKNLRESWEEELPDGSIVGQRITPIERVGVYVPGGKAFYPSSVLMNVVPAQVAGVAEIIMVSPPTYEGSIHPVVLAAAKIAGVSRVFRIGGAQAIAALAYGTDTVPKVMKITGPGNTYVTVAKSLARSVCDIDTEAGPSEVAVVADASANPRFVAGELLAQAEHDEEAMSVLITTSEKLVDKVLAALDTEMETLSRVEIIRKSLDRKGAIVVVRDLDEAARLANRYAPEHLAIYTENPREVFENIPNAGAVMLGQNTTVVLGDYFAGPNHILPTGQRARFASPLSAEDFRKVSSVISFSEEGLRSAGEDIKRMAYAEELTAHARAIEMRQ